jgi:hypothetical protein
MMAEIKVREGESVFATTRGVCALQTTKCDGHIDRRYSTRKAGFWRRPIDLRTPVRSPAARARLTIYVPRRPLATSLPAGCVPPRRASSKDAAQKCKNPTEMNPVGFYLTRSLPLTRLLPSQA